MRARPAEPLLDGDPRRIGGYELLGRLGAGGMGTVYLARSPARRPLAVKTIHPHLTTDPHFRDRFAREVAAARQVSGFYTATVVDADAEAAVPWLATEYIQGPSLADRVVHEGPLPAADVLDLAAGIAEALVSIHAAGLVHRDLKPSNVMLSAEGPKVIDFGIARAVEPEDVEPGTLTGKGGVVGTYEYIAPEQAVGRPV